MPISDVVRYAVRLVSRSRPEDLQAPKHVVTRWWKSARFAVSAFGQKARAAVLESFVPTTIACGRPSRCSHRILTNFNARAQKITVPDVIEKLLQEVTP
jgi:hypothetical protein